MTIVYPTNLVDTFPGWSTDFELQYRQEQSRTAGGKTYVKDLGSPLWRATYQSKTLSPNQLDEWRARLDAMENGLQTFRAWHMPRMYPIAYPNGSWPTGGAFSGTGTVGTINANRKAIAASGFPAGFTFKIGDLVQIGGADLHRVMENATSGQFEIRPHLWPGVSVGAALKVLRPSCVMSIVPGSISSTADLATGRGRITFEAMEAR